LHSGCLELIANESVGKVSDLRGKRVGMHHASAPSHVLVALMAAYIGLDPVNDIQWVVEINDPAEAFVAGKFDAFLATPPETQKLRGKKIGHTIVNTTLDPPWSQHFCCMISVKADYAERCPVATKRVVRAILKSADLCSSNPSWSAKQVVDQGFVPNYEYALQTLSDIRYGIWRDFDPEASVRFYALRMQETGMIKSSPQEVITKGTDWRFLNELKREMKT